MILLLQNSYSAIFWFELWFFFSWNAYCKGEAKQTSNYSDVGLVLLTYQFQFHSTSFEVNGNFPGYHLKWKLVFNIQQTIPLAVLFDLMSAYLIIQQICAALLKSFSNKETKHYNQPTMVKHKSVLFSSTVLEFSKFPV